MDRRQFIAAASATAVGATAGCAGGPLDTAQGEENGSEGGNESYAGQTEIAVGARGEVETEPDQAIASIGVRATGETAEAVNEELADRSAAVRETLADLGIPDDNIESGRYDLRQNHDGAGYEGTHVFQVTIEDVDRVGEVIDAAVAAGANDVGRVNFGLSDELRAEMRDAALDRALENADAEAAHVADNRGVEIVATRSVSTRNVDTIPVEYGPTLEAAADDAGAAGTEFDTGPVSVSATVDVVYAAE